MDEVEKEQLILHLRELGYFRFKSTENLYRKFFTVEELRIVEEEALRRLLEEVRRKKR